MIDFKVQFMENLRMVKIKRNVREIQMQVADDGQFTTVNPKCYHKLENGEKML